MREFAELLCEHGLEHMMLGILAVENHDRRLAVKITDGNANIMIPRGDTAPV